jgi:hypothetical protein
MVGYQTWSTWTPSHLGRAPLGHRFTWSSSNLDPTRPNPSGSDLILTDFKTFSTHSIIFRHPLSSRLWWLTVRTRVILLVTQTIRLIIIHESIMNTNEKILESSLDSFGGFEWYDLLKVSSVIPFSSRIFRISALYIILCYPATPTKITTTSRIPATTENRYSIQGAFFFPTRSTMWFRVRTNIFVSKPGLHITVIWYYGVTHTWHWLTPMIEVRFTLFKLVRSPPDFTRPVR